MRREKMDKDVIYVKRLDHDKAVENRKKTFNDAYAGIIAENLEELLNAIDIKAMLWMNIESQIKKAKDSDGT